MGGILKEKKKKSVLTAGWLIPLVLGHGQYEMFLFAAVKD